MNNYRLNFISRCRLRSSPRSPQTLVFATKWTSEKCPLKIMKLDKWTGRTASWLMFCWLLTLKQAWKLLDAPRIRCLHSQSSMVPSLIHPWCLDLSLVPVVFMFIHPCPSCPCWTLRSFPHLSFTPPPLLRCCCCFAMRLRLFGRFVCGSSFRSI